MLPLKCEDITKLMDLSSCPICNAMVPLSQLERHANSHFEDEDAAMDMELARQIALQPENPPQNMDNQVKPEIPIPSLKLNFEFGPGKNTTKCNYDMDGNGNAVALLTSLQMKGSFHKIEGGLIALLKKCLESENGWSTCILSGYVDHFQVESEDDGWGCGWRNVQMLSSNLLRERQEAREVLFGGSDFIPDISSLQRWLEIAWERGFDLAGAEHFSHRIYGSDNWIGTTECAALLRSFGLRARIVDFGPKKHESLYLSVPGSKRGSQFMGCTNRHKTNSMEVCGPMDAYVVRKKSIKPEAGSSVENPSESTHELGGDLSISSSNASKGQQVLVDWVWNYFCDGSLVKAGSRSITVSKKSPLYFQHEGHSRTIVGIQVKHQVNGMQRYSLLVLDPGHRTTALEKSLRTNSGWQRLIKRGVHTLNKPQYQLCYIDPGIAVGEELEQLKTIDSVYIDL